MNQKYLKILQLYPHANDFAREFLEGYDDKLLWHGEYDEADLAEVELSSKEPTIALLFGAKFCLNVLHAWREEKITLSRVNQLLAEAARQANLSVELFLMEILEMSKVASSPLNPSFAQDGVASAVLENNGFEYDESMHIHRRR